MARVETTQRRPARLEYVPAIDGLRAVAVSLVLLFHGGWGLFTGGYVGVSLFFTLSGYLITTLLLAEHAGTGSISFRAFFSRRVKRLLPASAVCLVGVVVLALAGNFSTNEGLGGDVAASALQVANWRALGRGQSYAELIGAARPGPLDHFWSLSIEEQFYWLWPLTLFVILRRSRVRWRRPGALGVTVLAGVAAVVPFVVRAGWGADAVYWATPARFGEILVGAVLAVWMAGRAWPRWGTWAGWMGLAAVCAAAVTWSAGSGPAYDGFLPLFAVASAATVMGASSAGSFARVLGIRPLVGLGRISYGVYLYHWPVFVLLDRDRLHLDRAALFAVRVVVTLVVAVVSYVLVERPVRNGRPRPSTVAVLAVIGTAAVVLAALTVVPDTEPLFVSHVDTGTVGLDDVVPSSSVVGVRAGPLRIVVMGDSAATALGSGMVSWAQDDMSRARLSVIAQPGCGFTHAVAVAASDEFRAGCAELLDSGVDAALAKHPDVVVLMLALADTGPLVWNEAEGVLQPDDPRYRAHLDADYDDLLARIAAAGVLRVEWVLSPQPAQWWFGYCCAEASPALDLRTATIEVVAGRHPELVVVRHLDDWLVEREASGDESYRPDGLHLGRDGAKRVMDEYLGPLLLAED
jgi:peptidoglycan/LPS O-acetylase OafA/YrhL